MHPLESQVRSLRRWSRVQTAMIVGLAVVGLFAAADQVDEVPENLVVKSLTVTDEGGSKVRVAPDSIFVEHRRGQRVNLTAQPNVSGVWVQQAPSGPMAALYTDTKSPVMGLCEDPQNRKGNPTVYDLVFGVFEGKPFVQDAQGKHYPAIPTPKSAPDSKSADRD